MEIQSTPATYVTLKWGITHHTGKSLVKVPRYTVGRLLSTAHSNGIGDVHKVAVDVQGKEYEIMLVARDVEMIA